jgi:hypothetical protein
MISMPYAKGTRLPGEMASKLGHLEIIQSEWVQDLIQKFEFSSHEHEDLSETSWVSFDPKGVQPLPIIWAVDGSDSTVASNDYPKKEVSFVKTAMLTMDKIKLDKIDKDNPHPLLLQDALTGSALFHATVFPLKNIRTKKGTNYDAIRHIVRDSIQMDQDGEYYKTLKWLTYQQWTEKRDIKSPSFQCPHCWENREDKMPRLSFDSDEGVCPSCKKSVFLTDMIGFHLDMGEDSAPASIASAYRDILEILMLVTAIRLTWCHSDKSLVSQTLFIKDGPLTLRGQYSKLVPSLRDFLEFSKKQSRPLHLIGQEKTGIFKDHLTSIVRFAPPKSREENLSFSVLSHNYVRKEVYRTPNLTNPYGMRTNWGEKVYVKVDPGTHLVINIPTGNYEMRGDFPGQTDLIGLQRILVTLPSLISHKHEGALFPIELANGIASLSSYPSAKVLQLFAGFQ